MTARLPCSTISCASRVASPPSTKHRSASRTCAFAGNGIRCGQIRGFKEFSPLRSRRQFTSASGLRLGADIFNRTELFLQCSANFAHGPMIETRKCRVPWLVPGSNDLTTPGGASALPGVGLVNANGVFKLARLPSAAAELLDAALPAGSARDAAGAARSS